VTSDSATGYTTEAPDAAVTRSAAALEPLSCATTPLLDSTTITARQEFNRRRRTGRCYQSCISGLKLKGTYRFITLTTSDRALLVGKDIQQSFRALLGRLRRRGLCSGYVKVVEFTKRGLPHLHVLMRGPYVPQWRLSEMWGEIHLSPIVDVRAVRGQVGAARYLAKYLGKDPESRLACSWDWVWKGFRGDWKLIVKWSNWRNYDLRTIVQRWDMMLVLYGHRPARDGPYLRGV